MKKSYIIAPLALLIVGGAYAMTGLLFPDTPGFPRIPTGEGTVGGMIARVLGISDLLTYSGDGMVKNTSMLSGTTATGYLKRTDICTSGQYWTGIGPDGKATCGSTTILLADMGTITDVGNGMTIFRADGTTIAPVNVPTTVKSGDIIKTDGTGTGTITFSDLSIIRIDTDTTVSMDQTTSGTGVTVASALLANGSVWGRILTDTGVYNIGSSDIVAAVRGTSIVVMQTGATTSVDKDPITNKFVITKTGTQGKTVLSILDSALGTGTISTVNCRKVSTVIMNGAMGSTPPDGPPSIPGEEEVTTSIATGSITPEKMYLVSPGDCKNGSTLSGMAPSALYTMSPWVKENTKKDIIYMSDLSESGSLNDWMKKEKILKELVETNPNNTTECTNLLGAGGTECADMITQGNTEKGISSPTNPPVAPRMARCRVENKKYWGMYRGQFNRQNDMCQDAGVIAIADYTIYNQGKLVIGNTLELAPQSETKVTEIYDDGNFSKAMNNKGSDFNPPTNGIWDINTMRGPTCTSNCRSFLSSYSTDTSFYLPSGSVGIYHNGGSPWDKWKYLNGLYIRKAINLSTTSLGVDISGITNLYISYPLSQLSSILTTGKTIEIEFNGLPTGVNGSPNNLGSVVMDLGNNLRVATKVTTIGTVTTRTWSCNYLASPNPAIADCTTSNLSPFLVTPPLPGSDKLSIRITRTITPERFIIGNNQGSNFIQPINTTIKSIKIK